MPHMVAYVCQQLYGRRASIGKTGRRQPLATSALSPARRVARSVQQVGKRALFDRPAHEITLHLMALVGSGFAQPSADFLQHRIAGGMAE